MKAAKLYRLALLFLPDRHDIIIQAGNCFKEAGSYDLAVKLYDSASREDVGAEALLQKGDALARGGAATEAVEALEAAMVRGHPQGEARLSEVSQFGLLGSDNKVLKRSGPMRQPFSERYLLNRFTREPISDRSWLGDLNRSAQGKGVGVGVFWRDHIAFTQIGWLRLRTRGRAEPILSGVVAVRARIVSRKAIEKVSLFIGGRLIAEGEVSFVQEHETGRNLYATNMWIDTNKLPLGRKSLSLSVFSEGEKTLSASAVVNIARPPKDFDPFRSDAYVPSAASVEANEVARAVAGRPPEVRSAKRSSIPARARNVLVMRVDQLGDLSASLPAFQRLRSLYPDARLTAVVAPGLVDVVVACGFCDEVLPLSLVYDHSTEKRYLDLTEERRLRALLEGRSFDIAVDLCPGDETRPLLKMMDAKYLVGFNPRSFDYLDFGIDVISRDKVNRIANISHAASVLMLVRCLEEALNAERPVVPRIKDDQKILASFGLAPKGYVIIHTGARHALNRWPLESYLELAALIVDEYDSPVVFFVDEEIGDDAISCARPDKIVLLRKTTMDVFDALLSNAALMIGNDSGPKHLAAMRGVETVSLHVNRLNWSEWGQDGRGVIISKRVPCAGCGLNDIAVCAKEVLCLRSITVNEVSKVVFDRLEISMRRSVAVGRRE